MIVLRWFGAQSIGLVLSVLWILSDIYRNSHLLGTSGFVISHYADKFVIAGMTLCLFPLSDFIMRGTDANEQSFCQGVGNAWIVFISLILMICLSTSLGMMLIADANMLSPDVQLWVFNGYPILLVAAFLVSIGYAFRVEVMKKRNRKKEMVK